jgi:uncharacterized protein (TIGR03083 family)
MLLTLQERETAMTAPRASDLDYLAHLTRESARFATAIAMAAPDDRVPSCPGWTADDLLWHLTKVQWFWGTVVREGVDREGAEALAPERPPDRAALAEFFAKTSAGLGAALAAVASAPDTPAWTWTDDQTVGWIMRRQAHESLIHRVDAEETACDRTTMDPRLSADGVDEALRIMYGGTLPAWGVFTPDHGRTVRIQATDTKDSWFLALGQFEGTDPADRRAYDQPGIATADTDAGTPASATIAGSAADLDCWLWHREHAGDLARSGDPEVLSRFDAIISAGID